MRTIVAGGRGFNDSGLLADELDHFEEYHSSSELIVVSGCAKGADKLGEVWAGSCDRKVVKFPADWEKHGKSAGFIRNREMANYAEALVAFWDGKSKGTKSMIDIALRLGLVVKVVRYTNGE